MSYPIPVPKEVEDVLTTAANQQLAAARNHVASSFESGELEFEQAITLCNLIDYELQLRQVEPLWRKAARFAKRNKNDLGAVAAVVGLVAGVNLLG
jgi:hypothetical protein